MYAAPDKPERPVVIKSVNNTATIQLKPVLPSHGPITSYRIIVLNEDAASIGVHKDSPLKNWAEAKAENLPFYIAAELRPEVCSITIIYSEICIAFLTKLIFVLSFSSKSL